MTRLALINFGNEESYGLLFVAQKLKLYGQIKFFDYNNEHMFNILDQYNPDYVFMSPMSVFYNDALKVEEHVRAHCKDVTVVYGGHHACNCGEQLGHVTVIGDGDMEVLDAIMVRKERGIIKGRYPNPETLGLPARPEYYRDIPRMRTRYRKIMLSTLGCPFSCTYCSSSNKKTKTSYNNTNFNLKRRDLDEVLLEASYIKKDTKEIEWVDDDVLYGDKDWMIHFFRKWGVEVGLPMYVSTTSMMANRADKMLLRAMRSHVNVIGMGVQAIRPESLALLGRSWDNYGQIKEAYDKLGSYGFRVNLQAIVGLPIPDPVEDALETVKALKDIGPGSICSVYPLQVYKNTEMYNHAIHSGYKLNQNAGDTNTGITGITFDEVTGKRLRNICKLATFYVKYNLDDDLLRALIDIDFSDDVSHKLSMLRYRDCVTDRLGYAGLNIFNDIIKTMNLRF